MSWPMDTEGNPLPCTRCGKTGLELSGNTGTCPALPEAACIPPEEGPKVPDCPHRELDFHFHDAFFEDRPGLHVFHLKANCSQCKLPFHFVNAPRGVVFTGGVASPDGMELQVAMAAGEHPDPINKERRSIRLIQQSVEETRGQVLDFITKSDKGNLPN